MQDLMDFYIKPSEPALFTRVLLISLIETPPSFLSLLTFLVEKGCKKGKPEEQELREKEKTDVVAH